LGTSDRTEAKEYFSNLDRNLIPFTTLSADPVGEVEVSNMIDMCFNKKKAEQRKIWINGYEDGTHVDFNVDEMAYSDFVDKEYIIMAVQSNLRGIPHVIDGFKPSQRKILFSCLKRKLHSEIKVAQLAGYVNSSHRWPIVVVPSLLCHRCCSIVVVPLLLFYHWYIVVVPSLLHRYAIVGRSLLFHRCCCAIVVGASLFNAFLSLVFQPRALLTFFFLFCHFLSLPATSFQVHLRTRRVPPRGSVVERCHHQHGPRLYWQQQFKPLDAKRSIWNAVGRGERRRQSPLRVYAIDVRDLCN
jgi:hypothetical protein